MFWRVGRLCRDPECDEAGLVGRPLSMLEVFPRFIPRGLRVLCLRGPGEGVSRDILGILGSACVAERFLDLDGWKSRMRTSLVSDMAPLQYDFAVVNGECWSGGIRRRK